MKASELIRQLTMYKDNYGDKEIYIEQFCPSCDELNVENDVYLYFLDENGDIEPDESRCKNCVGFILNKPSWS